MCDNFWCSILFDKIKNLIAFVWRSRKSLNQQPILEIFQSKLLHSSSLSNQHWTNQIVFNYERTFKSSIASSSYYISLRGVKIVIRVLQIIKMSSDFLLRTINKIIYFCNSKNMAFPKKIFFFDNFLFTSVQPGITKSCWSSRTNYI